MSNIVYYEPFISLIFNSQISTSAYDSLLCEISFRGRKEMISQKSKTVARLYKKNSNTDHQCHRSFSKCIYVYASKVYANNSS